MTVKEILSQIPIPPLHPCGSQLDKWYRIKSFYCMLDEEGAATNAEATLELINRTIVWIEDCHSGMEAEENPTLKYNGRMYPIQDDNIDRRGDGRIVAITKGNRIVIEPNGSFSIFNRIDDEIILTKGHE